MANIGSGSITVLDVTAGERVRNVATGAGAEGIAVTRQGEQIWVTNREAGTITVLDAASFDVVKELPSSGFPIRATATPRDQVLVTRAEAGALTVYDARSLAEVRTIRFDLESLDVEERLFGDRFGDSSVPIGVITEVDLATGAMTRVLRAGKEPDGMGYSPLAAGR